MTTCNACGAQNPEAARFCQTCGAQLGALSAEAESQRAAIVYGGFWRRFVAIILDTIIVSFGAAILFGAASFAGGFASLFLPWVYEAYMLSSKKQATVGKMVMGIIVTNTDGKPISFARATGRHFAKYLSCLILGIGFVIAAFSEKRQALHDMIADTLVLTAE